MKFLLNDGPLREGLPYGRLFFVLFGSAMAFVIILGSTLGDCEPGLSCRDNVGGKILLRLLFVVPVALGAGAMVSMIAAVLLRIFDGVPRVLVKILLTALTIFAAYFALYPAVLFMPI